jgi:polyribonucleotide nucleotidyltransferase
MDFKVAGSKEGITSFQMDIKVEGITTDIMRKALSQAKDGRLFILEKMTHAIPKPADDLSDYAPRITTMQIDQEKIGELIGPGGRNVRTISETCNAEINIEDSGVVTIAATNAAASAQAIDMIRSSIAEVEVGKIYEGKVKRIMEYGAFVEIVPGKEGLCHISKLDRRRVRNVSDVVKEGETIQVKVLGVDRSGKIDLSRKDALPQQ